MKTYTKVLIGLLAAIVIVALGVVYVNMATEKTVKKTTAPNGISVELMDTEKSPYKGDSKKHELYTYTVKLTNEQNQVETVGGVDFELEGTKEKKVTVAPDFESFVTEVKPDAKGITKKIFFKVAKGYQPSHLTYHYSINDSVQIPVK